MIDITTSYETLKYKQPLPVRGVYISENRFLKVTLLQTDYFISVLPGFHEASLEEIAFKLNYLFANYSFDFGHIDFNKRFFNLLSPDDFLNSIQHETLFNIETILLDMIKRTHPAFFKNDEILENELYRTNSDPLTYNNSKCLKIKISPSSVEETILLINQLHNLNRNLILRFDGNRQFDLSAIIELEKKLKQNISPESLAKIDYIEEPFKKFSDTFLFQKRGELTIAMDESFSTLNTMPVDLFPKDMPIVIKPSLFGISFIHNWMQIHSKKRIIISSSFEHPSVKIGLVFLADLRPFEYHGLEKVF